MDQITHINTMTSKENGTQTNWFRYEIIKAIW